MPIIDITPYHTGNKRHQFYAETVKQFNDIKTHALGEMPMDLIKERRPGESETIRKYREKIYIPKTQSAVSKVVNSLQKIRKSQDYVWQFDETIVPPIIAAEERPSYYLNNDFPKYGSLDNWFWSVAFNQYLMDAGAIILTSPISWTKQDNEYFKPYPVLYNSPNVLDHIDGVLTVLKSQEKSQYKAGNRTMSGDVYYTVDTISICRYVQIDGKGNFSVEEYIHNLGYVPVTRTNGIILKDSVSDCLYTSRIHSMVPSLNEAAREYSDLQAEVVQNVHSTLWFISGKECNTCHGTGMVPKANASPVQCDECNGKGMYPFNPYEHISLKMPTMGEAMPPTPPAGYLSKPIEIAQLQDKRVYDHIYHALSSLNMEFLASVPLSQSGTAKEVDRAELNNFVYSIAEDCIRIIDEICETVIDYRYGGIITDSETREKLAPMITVPEKYDMIPESYLVDEISKLRTSKVSPVIINAAELEYANKKFNTNQKIKQRLQDIYELDPLAGMATDDIMVGLSNQAINKKTYVIHCNIREFVDSAHETDPMFYQLSMTDKKQVISQLADQWILDNSPRTITSLPINANTGNQ